MKEYLNALLEKAWARINNVYAFSINESATDRYIDRLISENLPDNLKEYANTAVGELVSKNIVNAMALGTTDEELKERKDESLKDYIRISICKDFDIYHGHGPVKYMRGIFRIVILEFNYLTRPDRDLIETFKGDVLYIAEAVKNGIDQEAAALDGNFNGMSSEDIHDMFYEKRKAYAEKLRNSVLSNFSSDGGSDYDVELMTSAKDCAKYGKYTSWCITRSKANYDGYTDGGRRFYFFLKHGFEDIEITDTSNAPLDEYGLSMISILVNLDGDIDYITTRYNHAHDGEYNKPDENTIIFFQNVIGMNLYEVCKPYTPEELEKLGIMTPDMAMQRLNSGESLEKVFDNVQYDNSNGYVVVSLYIIGKSNLLDNNRKPVLKKWIDNIRVLSGGYYCIYKNNRANVIDSKGRVLFDKGFDGVIGVGDNIFVVYNRDEKYKNIYYGIGLDGKVILGPYGYLSTFVNGYAIAADEYNINGINNIFLIDTSLNIKPIKGKYGAIRGIGDSNILEKVKGGPIFSVDIPRSDGGWNKNIINYKGELLLDDNYTYIGGFRSVNNKIVCVVAKEGGYNIIDKNLEPVSEIWFDSCSLYYGEKGPYCAYVILDDKYNKMKLDGELLLKRWSEQPLEYFNENYIYVVNDHKHNLASVSTPDDYYFDEWFDDMDDYIGMTRVKYNGKYNYLDKDLNFVLDTWLDDADSFYSGFIHNGARYTRMCIDGEYNFFDENLVPLFDHGFEYALPFKNLKAVVKINGKYNVINKKGKLLLKQWYDGISNFRNGFAIVELDGKFNFIDKKGNLLCDRWFDKAKPFVSGYGKVYYKDYDGKIRKEYEVDAEGNYYGPRILSRPLKA